MLCLARDMAASNPRKEFFEPSRQTMILLNCINKMNHVEHKSVRFNYQNKARTKPFYLCDILKAMIFAFIDASFDVSILKCFALTGS